LAKIESISLGGTLVAVSDNVDKMPITLLILFSSSFIIALRRNYYYSILQMSKSRLTEIEKLA
jgi:hypothetical protein